ncbi:MAG TPA: hypothetical protein DET40_10260 [Lentisphaeria bacterium]|nr:MAG: hypothetical protein A2X45_10020 [Lentisphaerae bacterium GWF2_50_93]HCE43919.1 hypothetical protein [Lentisphaeria bacterium]
MAEFVRSSACLRVLQSFEIPLRTRKHALLQAKNLKSDRLHRRVNLQVGIEESGLFHFHWIISIFIPFRGLTATKSIV